MEKTKQLILLVGPAGSGKSTLARQLNTMEAFVRINQDEQGRGHLAFFDETVLAGQNVVVDRMNFTKGQRSRYIDIAKSQGYTTKIIVLHQPYEVCLERCIKRQGHETIQDEASARGALNMFFSKYERVEDGEADVVERRWPDGPKPLAVWSDLDGTLCEVSHRRHFVRRPQGEKKDWNGFFKAMSEDTVNVPVMETLKRFSHTHAIVYCSGRPDNYKKETKIWLKENGAPEGSLFMRLRNDQRQDNIVKEVLLDFEVLTRYRLLFCMDDRDQAIRMLRNRGLSVFQVADGDF